MKTSPVCGFLIPEYFKGGKRLSALLSWFLISFAGGDGGLAAPAGADLKVGFSSPLAEHTQNFGSTIATIGEHHVVIGGATDETNAFFHLFDVSGSFIKTYVVTNPSPAPGVIFETPSLAGLGEGRFLIGTTTRNPSSAMSTSGSVQLLGTNGAVLTTFSNPTLDAGDFFGCTVAALGNDGVLVGAFGATNLTGAAYLFSTNGALITSFQNPTPEQGDGFGWVLAALGDDRVIINAQGDNGGLGTVYVYDTQGKLLTTIHGPPDEAGFGYAVSAVGTDKIIVGSPFSNVGAVYAGSAYLYSANGTLLKTYRNPHPVALDNFGVSVAGFGANRVIIGEAQLNSGRTIGYAYVFSVDGDLLNVVTNTSPFSGNGFGKPVVSAGLDHLLVGAAFQSAGRAYVFSLPYPKLSITGSSDIISIRWDSLEMGIAVQQSNQIDSPTWTNVSEPISVVGSVHTVQQSITSGNRFFRLARQ